SDGGHIGASDSPCCHAVELQAAHAPGATYAIANLSVPQGWASVSWRCAVGQTEHLAQEGLQLFWIERLGDDRSATVLDRNYSGLVPGQEKEGYATGRQDRTYRETRPALQVDVQNSAIKRTYSGQVQGAFKLAGRADRFKARLP